MESKLRKARGLRIAILVNSGHIGREQKPYLIKTVQCTDYIHVGEGKNYYMS